MGSFRWLIIAAGAILVLSYNACSEVEFAQPEGIFAAGGPGSPGVPVDPGSIPECEGVDIGNFRGACVVFQDRFERDQIVHQGDFKWNSIIMDNGYNGSNVDAQIENSQHLGPILDGDRAVLFRGRQGGSTHEIYLISQAFDFSGFDRVYIQYQYVPLHLEEEIRLTYNGRRLPESVRVDVCKESDQVCGLSGSNRHERLRNPAPWDSFFMEPLELGRNLNIRDYNRSDWKLGQTYVELSDYSSRQDNFVFRVAAAMTEGYDNNNRNRHMDDGIIFDNIILIAVRGIDSP